MTTANSNAHIIGTVALKDVADKPGTTTVRISVEKDNLALVIHPEGTGTWDGPYAPILLERNYGSTRLLVWADINQQDPTHVIDLFNALETNRSADTDY
jgi:hypothetical protein